MDIKAKAAELVEKIKNDPALLRQFRENPVKVLETLLVAVQEDKLENAAEQLTAAARKLI